MRTIFIGDVHGCLYELKRLLDKLNYCSKERLIFVGDLINKGPFSLKTLEFVRSLNAECVLGNHELQFLEHLQKNTKLNYKALRSLKEHMSYQLSLWEKWLSDLPLYIEEEDFLVVHAGLKPYTHPSKTPRYILTNIRTWDKTGKNLNRKDCPPWYDFYEETRPVIYGHWSLQGLLERTNTIGLDSGCVYGEKLSAFVLPERQIYQVEAYENYNALYGEKGDC